MDIKGQPSKFVLTDSDYAAAGIDPETTEPAAQILRFLLHKYGEELFLSDAELLTKCGRADAGLSRFLRWHEWRHPDISGLEGPSVMETFQRLANAIVANDPALAVAEEAPNTHWRNWPEL